MLASLTHREARVVKYLGGQLGRPRVPGVEELAQAAGLSSRGCEIASILDSLEDKGYIGRDRGKTRSLRLLYCSGGRAVNPQSIRMPPVRLIGAGEPLPVPSGDSQPLGSQPFAGEMAELTFNMLGGHEDVYALRLKGESVTDELSSDGDIAIIRRQPSVDNGQMAAVRLNSGEGTTLKYFHREGDSVRLQPANSAMEPLYYHPSEVEVQGKVLTVIRRLA